jgi:hypothetical protein
MFKKAEAAIDVPMPPDVEERDLGVFVVSLCSAV